MKDWRKFPFLEYLMFNVRCDKRSRKCARIIKILNVILKEGEGCRYYKKTIPKGLPKEYNFGIVDLEGDNSIKLMGILLGDTIYQFELASDPTKFSNFLALIIRTLIISDIILFGFTYWDLDKIYKIIENSDLEPTEKKETKHKLFYINLQKRSYESVSEALFNLGEEPPSDPLFRDGTKIDSLYESGYTEIIREHNISCLLGEAIILKKRYLKYFLIV